MKTEKEQTKELITQRQSELTKKIIKGTENIDNDGEFVYNNDDLFKLCQLNQLSESI